MKKFLPLAQTLCASGTLLFILSSQASESRIPSWVQSYSANGICYCQQPTSTKASRTIVGTPVGGQSIEQICRRIGPGPTLGLREGQFDFPVYTDAQCGNGPELRSDDVALTGCEGRLFLDDSVCGGSGPVWDLAAAYSRKNKQSTKASEIDSSVVVTTKLAVNPEPSKTTSDSLIDTALNAVVNNGTEISKSDDEPVLAKNSPSELVSDPREIQAPPLGTPIVRSIPAMDDSLDAESADSATLPLAETFNSPALESDSTPVIAATTENDTKTPDEAVTVVTDSAGSDVNETPVPATALKLPIRVRQRRPALNYLQIAPVGYDFGGAGGSVQGSVEFFPRWRVVASAVGTQDYNEFSVGFGFTHDFATISQLGFGVSSGVEYGEFDLGLTELDDSGAFITGWLSYSLLQNLKLATGVSYSSFFEGDPSVFAQGLFRLSKNLDLSGRAELGDNDNVGIGIRFHFR